MSMANLVSSCLQYPYVQHTPEKAFPSTGLPVQIYGQSLYACHLMKLIWISRYNKQLTIHYDQLRHIQASALVCENFLCEVCLCLHIVVRLRKLSLPVNVCARVNCMWQLALLLYWRRSTA